MKHRYRSNPIKAAVFLIKNLVAYELCLIYIVLLCAGIGFAATKKQVSQSVVSISHIK